MGTGEKQMIWIILLLGLILRLISLSQSLWLDEAINTLASKNYSLIDLVAQYARADFHPPGWFIILWFWSKIFGYSEIAVRVPSVIFGLLTIWITYLLSKKLISKRVGVIAALFISINPLHIYYSQEARMYALATLAVLVSMLSFLKLVKGEKINLFLLILSNIFVLISDYIAYFIFPAQFVFLLSYKKSLLKKWFLALALAVASGFWWLPTFLGQFNVGSVASANLPTWKFVAGGFDFKTIPLTFVKFIIGRISLTDKILYAGVLLPVCSLFAFLLYKGIRSCDNLSKKLLIFWIIIPLIFASIISIWIPVYNFFRVLFILPAFIILTSAGIFFFKKKIQYDFLIIIFSIEFFCSLVYLFNPSFHREDWKGLVNFLNSKQSVTILFESSGTLPPFDYYAKNKFDAKGGLKDFPVRQESDVVDLSNLGKDIYLVDYLVEISDPNRLIAKRLKELGYKQTDTLDFRGVGFVYHYIKYD